MLTVQFCKAPSGGNDRKVEVTETSDLADKTSDTSWCCFTVEIGYLFPSVRRVSNYVKA